MKSITKDEALKMALEALEGKYSITASMLNQQFKALIAIQEALAQPAQEPVAMRYDYDGYGYKYIDSGSGSDWQTRIKDAEPIYAIPPSAQPAQEPRLDQGPDYERGFVDGRLYQTKTSVDKAVNAIAQPAQEPMAKPTPEPTPEELEKIMLEVWQPVQPAQEPVAWMNNKDFEPIRVRIMQEAYEFADRNDSESYNAIKVMCGDVQRMLPPQRTWVELTDEEIRPFDVDPIEAKQMIAKLKEKNT